MHSGDAFEKPPKVNRRIRKKDQKGGRGRGPKIAVRGPRKGDQAITSHIKSGEYHTSVVGQDRRPM